MLDVSITFLVGDVGVAEQAIAATAILRPIYFSVVGHTPEKFAGLYRQALLRCTTWGATTWHLNDSF